MDARVPIWMVPAHVGVGPTPATRRLQRGLRGRVSDTLHIPESTARSTSTAGRRPSLDERPAGADLSLQGMSDRLSGSLNRASRSLSSLLNAASGDPDEARSPFKVTAKGAGKAAQMSWKAGTSTMKILGDILEESSSGGGSGGFSGGGFRSSSWGGGGGSRSSGGSSRSSGGGGSRGFG